MSTDFIPQADAKFYEWQKNLLNYAGTHSTTWNIPEKGMTAIVALQADFENKYAIAETPETRTSVAILAKTEARRTLETSLRAFLKSYIMYNPDVTDADKRAMALPLHDTKPTPTPVPTTYPEAEADTSVIRRLTLHFHDNGSKSKAKPAGVHGAEIRWAILDTPPATINELTTSSFDTHTPFTLQFEENQRGKTVYFCLCWENTRGEKGAWGEIVSAIIP
jgi:hypothetical protein